MNLHTSYLHGDDHKELMMEVMMMMWMWMMRIIIALLLNTKGYDIARVIMMIL
jgi:hypothetical protein